jgi:hypothetical protein
VTIAGHSGAARSLFALSSSPTASILVNVNEIDQNGNVLSGGLSGFILLNADGTVPTLTNPDSAPTNTNITGVEIYTPGITGPGITGSNANAMTITSPGITGPGITGSSCTPGITGPGITGPGITGTGCVAPGITGPGITGPGITGSTVVSPGITGPGITGPGITGSAVSDATYSVGSGANTNTGLTVKLAGCDISPCKDTPLQLIVSQIYTTPNTDGQCNLISVQQDITLSNVLHAAFIPVSQLSNPGITGSAASDAAFSLAPGDTALITLRGHTDIATMQKIVTQTAPLLVTPVNTNSTATSPSFSAPLFITSTTLVDGVVGKFYGASLEAIGGTTPYRSWSIPEIGGRLPPGLNLTLDSETGRGLISGFPTANGTYNFTVQVTDSANPSPNRATKQFSISVALALTVATASPLPSTCPGCVYGSFPLSTSGGTPPYSWAPVANIDGLSLDSSGVLSGTALTSGIFNFTAQVTDGASPPQIARKLMTLNVALAPAPPTNLAISSLSPSSVKLIWEFSTSSGVVGYNVYRATTSGGPYTKLSPVGASAFSFTDSTGAGGQTYYYVVTAVNASGVESPLSNQVFAIVPVGPIFFGQATDPVGDANGGGINPDLVWGSVTTMNDGTVKLSARYASGTFNPSNTEALFLLDTDQNAATGSSGSDPTCAAPDNALIGVDFVVAMQAGLGANSVANQAVIYKATGGSAPCNQFTQLGTASVTIFNDGMDVAFPVSTLVNIASSNTSGPATAGPWNFKVLAQFFSGRTFSGITDTMPNVGLAPASTAAAPLPVTPPPSGIVAWWPADGYPTDIQSNHGQVLTNITYAPSEVGQSFVFGGTSSSITVTDSADLTPAAVTVDFWFKSNINLPDVNNHPEVPFIFKLNPFDDANAVSKGYDFFYQFGAIGFGLPRAGGFRNIVYSSDGGTAITAGTWHHVAGTYDPTDTSFSAQKLYLDGVLVNSGANFGAIQYQQAAVQFGTVFNAANFGTGTNPNHTYFFNGQLDEIEIHNRALSASEIQAIFNAGSAGKAKP